MRTRCVAAPSGPSARARTSTVADRRSTGRTGLLKAVVFPEPQRIEITSFPDPSPGPRDVVVEVAACGICGTDLHILEGGFAASLPIVPGHEFAGQVVATGGEVFEVSVGDNVAVDPSLFC